MRSRNVYKNDIKVFIGGAYVKLSVPKGLQKDEAGQAAEEDDVDGVHLIHLLADEGEGEEENADGELPRRLVGAAEVLGVHQ